MALGHVYFVVSCKFDDLMGLQVRLQIELGRIWCVKEVAVI
jgi:hypothetical protein